VVELLGDVEVERTADPVGGGAVAVVGGHKGEHLIP
jgi:hypothetical protein